MYGYESIVEVLWDISRGKHTPVEDFWLRIYQGLPLKTN